MRGSCRVRLFAEKPPDPSEGKAGRWSLEEETLTVEPQGEGALSLPLERISGIAAEEETLTLRVGGRFLALDRLGADGPVLEDRLEAAWPPLRARALRIQGRGEPWALSCQASEGGGEPRPARLLLYDDLVAWAPAGEDLRPFFLALSGPPAFDAEGWGLDLPGPAPLRLTRMGARTGEAVERLRQSREGLVRTAGELLQGTLPEADPFDLGLLSGLLLPGKALSLEEVGRRAPSVPGALEGLLRRAPRRREAEALREGLLPSAVFFALTPREEASASESDEEKEGSADGAAKPEEEPDLPAVVWLLVRRGARWILEAPWERDRATYAFEGGDDLLLPLQALLCSPGFSREALYLPLERLTGERAAYAAAARDLPFLRELRSRLRVRAVHTSFDAWKAKLAL